MAKKTRASLNSNDFAKLARRRRNRVIRNTTVQARQGVTTAMGIIWPTYSALPEGSFSKSAKISTRNEAIVYRLAHPDFDLQGVMEACQPGRVRRKLTSSEVDSAVRKASLQSQAELRSLFTPSEDIIPDDAVTPEIHRYLSGLRGRDVAVYFENAFAAFVQQDQLALSHMSEEAIRWLLPAGSRQQQRAATAEQMGFDPTGVLAYRRWMTWSPKDTLPGLRAMDTLILELKALRRDLPEDFDALAERFCLAMFRTRPDSAGVSEEVLLAACIMAADYRGDTEQFVVTTDRFRAIADLYERHSHPAKAVKRRRR